MKKKLTSRPDLRFALLLARSMGRTLDELGRTCSAEEFGLWAALYEVEPWGPLRDDLAAGVIASTIANVNRGKDSPVFKPADFMPIMHPAEPVQEATGADFAQQFGALPGMHKSG